MTAELRGAAPPSQTLDPPRYADTLRAVLSASRARPRTALLRYGTTIRVEACSLARREGQRGLEPEPKAKYRGSAARTGTGTEGNRPREEGGAVRRDSRSAAGPNPDLTTTTEDAPQPRKPLTQQRGAEGSSPAPPSLPGGRPQVLLQPLAVERHQIVFGELEAFREAAEAAGAVELALLAAAGG